MFRSAAHVPRLSESRGPDEDRQSPPDGVSIFRLLWRVGKERPKGTARRTIGELRQCRKVTVRHYNIHTDFGDMEFTSDDVLGYWWERIISEEGLKSCFGNFENSLLK